MDIFKYKNKYNIIDLHTNMTKMYRSIFVLIRNRRKKFLSEEFIEKIMLAVTEVNGCAICSYAHTKMALKLGFTDKEIASILSNDGKSISNEEAKAIFFSQHYAEAQGKPDKEAYQAVINAYGKDKTKVIIASF